MLKKRYLSGYSGDIKEAKEKREDESNEKEVYCNKNEGLTGILIY